MDARSHGQRHNYIPPTSSGNNNAIAQIANQVKSLSSGAGFYVVR